MDFECILILICMQCYLVYMQLVTLSLAARERTNCALYVTGLHPLARISYSSLHVTRTDIYCMRAAVNWHCTAFTAITDVYRLQREGAFTAER